MSEALPLATPGVDYTTTTHYAFYKPVYNLDVGVWGDHVNANSDQLDTLIWNLNQGMLPLAGGTMTGPLTLAADPTANLQAATKQYVDNKAFLPITGGTLTGSVALSPGVIGAGAKVATLFAGLNIALNQQGNIGFNAYQNASSQWVSIAGGGVNYLTSNAGILSLWGANSSTAGSTVIPTQILQASTLGITMAGGTDITLVRDPTNALHAATKQYADKMLPLTGGTLSGALTVPSLTANGAVVFGATAMGGQCYVSADANSTVLNFQTNYALAFRRSDGLVYYAASGAPGGMAFNCSPAGNFSVGGNLTATGAVQGVNIIGTNACFPSYTQSNDFYMTGDASNLHLRWAGNWELYYQRSSGTMIYQRSGASWFNWRAGDAVTYNGIANQGGIGPYADYSDIRGKRDVEDASEGLEAVRLLRPVSFIRLPRTDYLPPPPRREIGFVAQDLQKVMPEAVMPFEDLDSDNPGLAIMTTPIVAALVNAVKELAARVETLEGGRHRRRH